MENNYKDLTRYIYQDLSWGPLFRFKDGRLLITLTIMQKSTLMTH